MDQTDTFLQALWDGKPESYAVQLWHKATKKSFYASNLDAAAGYARTTPDDMYMAAGLAKKALKPNKQRTLARDIVGIPGVWADIDVNGGPEDKHGAAPDIDAALALASDLLVPTVIVNSGYGLQAWWLFDGGPWAFGSEEEQAEGAQMIAAFQAALRAQAKKSGFNLDATHDLARLMRCPGTFNCKGADTGFDPAAVALLSADGPRHERDAIGEIGRGHLKGNDALRMMQGEGIDITVTPNAQAPFDKMQDLFEADITVKQLWEQQRNLKSHSEYEWGLTCKFIENGWTDQEVADALVHFRNRHEPGDPRGKNNARRIAQTIGKARSQTTLASVQAEADQDRAHAVEELTAMAHAPVPNRAKTLELFNRIVGCASVQVSELIQDSRDPDTARFRLMLEDGREVLLGVVENLTNQDRFRNRLAIATQHFPKGVKREKWEEAIGVVLQAAQVREEHDDSRIGRVLSWLEGYCSNRLSTDRDAACEMHDPFERDDFVFVPLAGLHHWLRKVRGERNVSEIDVKLILEAAGFERRTVSYTRSSGSRSSRSYFVAPKELLDPGGDAAAA